MLLVRQLSSMRWTYFVKREVDLHIPSRQSCGAADAASQREDAAFSRCAQRPTGNGIGTPRAAAISTRNPSLYVRRQPP